MHFSDKMGKEDALQVKEKDNKNNKSGARNSDSIQPSNPQPNITSAIILEIGKFFCGRGCCSCGGCPCADSDGASSCVFASSSSCSVACSSAVPFTKVSNVMANKLLI